MNECNFTDKKKICLLLALFFWVVPIFVENFGITLMVKLFPQDLLKEYFDCVFYGTFFLVTIIVFGKLFINAIKDFAIRYESCLNWSALCVFITLVLMIASAIILDSVGVDNSSNQESVDEAVTQYGLLPIITVCFIGPIVEEIFYRGILFEMFKGKNKHLIRSTVAILSTALLFAFMHVSFRDISANELLANIPIFMLGLTLATLRWKTDNILCPILVHIGINVISVFG